jgi:hypothetical protein
MGMDRESDVCWGESITPRHLLKQNGQKYPVDHKHREGGGREEDITPGVRLVSRSLRPTAHFPLTACSLLKSHSITLLAGPEGNTTPLVAPRDLLVKYSDYFMAVIEGAFYGKEQTIIDVKSCWPRTISNAIAIMHGADPNFSACPFDVDLSEEGMDSPQPLRELDHIFDLAGFASFIQYKADDIAEVVTKELSRRLKDKNRAMITEWHVKTIFEISERTMSIVRAWEVLSKALAPEFATFILTRDAHKRGRPFRNPTPFRLQKLYDEQTSLSTALNQKAMYLISSAKIQPGTKNMIAQDLLNGEWITVYED